MTHADPDDPVGYAGPFAFSRSQIATFADHSGLSLQEVEDKNGHRVHRWVSERGDADDQTPPHEHSHEGLAERIPHAARSAETVARVKEVASKIHDAVYGALARATPDVMRLLPE